jgi:hypothetical protein
MEAEASRKAAGRRRLSDLAEAGSADRDRYVDYLRAYSVVMVMLGHWLGAVIVWNEQELIGKSALDLVPGLWVVTWLFQVMPIFFFVGGFSNFVTIEGLRRLGEGARTFLSGRASRLLRPTAIFLLFWAIVAPFALRIPNLPEGAAGKALPVLVGPLWFLGVYLALVALSPIMVPLHHRYRLRLLLVLAVLPVLVDIARFAAGIEWAGLANLVFVWLFIHQLGFFYADGTFDRVPRRLFWVMAIGGFAVMFALTQMAAYPSSMVGCCSDEISNMAPPTLAIMSLGIWQIGLTMLIRPLLTRWLAHQGPWKAVIAVNGSIMTLFLWHLSALVVAVAALYPLGFPQPELGTGLWWLTRPLWLACLVVVLSGPVLLFGRFERPDLDPAERYWDLRAFYAL